MAFGATDYHSLADTVTEVQTGEIQTSADRANFMDSLGDMACETVSGEISTWVNSYRLIGGDTFAVSGYISGGTITAIDTNTNAVCTGIELETSNTARPLMTVTSVEFFGTDTANQPTYTPPFTGLARSKTAQAIGFTLAGSTKLTGCRASLTLQIEHVKDSVGDYAATDAYGAVAEVSGDLSICTGTPAAAADTANSWELSQEVDLSTNNEGYATGTINVFRNIARD